VLQLLSNSSTDTMISQQARSIVDFSTRCNFWHL